MQCVERRSRPKFSGCAPPVSKERKDYKMDLFAMELLNVMVFGFGVGLMISALFDKYLVKVKK